MAWKQITWPFLDDRYLTATDGNGNVLTDWYCWCLAVTQACCGITKKKYGSAIAAWNDNPDKFPVGPMDIPIGIYVPVFWAGGQYGHVAIAYRDGYDSMTVWSSPYTHKAYFDTFAGSPTDVVNQITRTYGMSKFLGWTASLTDTSIVAWVGTPTPEPEPTLSWTKFTEPTLYQAKLQPTHLWEVSGGWDSVKDLRTIDKGTEFWAFGQFYNRIVGQTYLVDSECLEKQIAKGYNVGDMEKIAEMVPLEPEPTPQDNQEDDTPADEGSGDLSHENTDNTNGNGENASEGGSVEPEQPPAVPEEHHVTREEFINALKENVANMEKFTDLVAEAGKGLNFSPLTKKIVYIVGDLLLLAGVEVAPVMAVINAQDAQELSQALTQALFTAGVGILLIFKLLKAKSAKQLSEDTPSES